MAKKPGEYEVGYRKPPRHTQFKPGVSGNKDGRKKGSRNLKTVLQEELNEKIPIVINGKKMKVTKQQAFVKTLMAKAIQGDMRAATLAMSTLLKVLPEEPGIEDDIDLTETDRAILDEFAASIIAAQTKSGKSDEP